MHIETNTENSKRTPSRRSVDLNALSRMSVRQLGDLFAKGQVPERLSALDGHPRGRMLAVRGLDRGRWFAGLRAFAGGARFPWGGKSFSSESRTQGTGINRVHLGGRHQLFPFKTHLGPSAIDGCPAVILDYDLADNPRVIRAIHDEVRLVDDGLYLGPAMWKTEREPVFVLWFALDTLNQAVPIGERGPS